MDRLQARVGQDEVIALREASVLFERELSACCIRCGCSKLAM
jgi:hypothetical protein